MVETAPNITKLYQKMKAETAESADNNAAFANLLQWMERMSKDESTSSKSEGYREFLLNDFQACLHNNGITGGVICEIGGPNNSFIREIPGFEFENISLYPSDGDDGVLVGDITQCEYIEPERYDAIFSVSVFEHVAKPWKASEQISRLLKPGGITYHSAPFSYFYHGAPADYYRYTPDAFEVLFSDLETVKAEFYGKNRRRDNRGSDSNRVDRDGGSEFSVDGFGGWRENWSSVYCGKKSVEHLREKQIVSEKQVILNLIKHLTKTGLSEDSAIDKVYSIIQGIRVSHDQEITSVGKGLGLRYSLSEVREIWETRGRNGLKPSYSRFVMARAVGI